MHKTTLSAATVLVMSAGVLLSAGTAHAATVLTVAPGQSIQAAIDAAQPGTTILLGPGTYQGSVLITKDDITIQGAGSGTGGTVIVPPATYPSNECGSKQAGICFRGTVVGTEGPTSYATSWINGGGVSGVRVDGFTVGISLSATDGAQVSDSAVVDSSVYGITDTVSKNSVIKSNVIQNAGRAAIYVGNYQIPKANAVLQANQITNGAYGISSYDTSGVTATENQVSNSCDGYFSYSDSYRVPGGEWLTVADNTFTDNNANCPGAYGFPQAVQGAGVILVGATQTTVENNAVVGNSGPDPLSGGIVLATSRTFDPAETVDESSVTVKDNALSGNGPDDIKWDSLGSAITFSGNACGTSAPAGLCG